MKCKHDHPGREKPDKVSVEMMECDCGQNKRCEVCRHEERKIPCSCTGEMKYKLDKRMKSERL